MIARYWKGIVKPNMAQAYMEHLQEDTLDIVSDMKGFRGASVLKKEVSNGVEFVVITEWDSIDTIAQFSGKDLEKAVVPDLAKSMMVTYDDRVIHYEVVHNRE